MSKTTKKDFSRYWHLAGVTGSRDLNTPEGSQNFIKAVAYGIGTKKGI